MTIAERVNLVRLLTAHLGDNGISDRHVRLDKVDEHYLLHKAEGMQTELNLDILGAVAIGAMDVRLVFLDEEVTEERRSHIEELVEKEQAIIVDELD